MLNDLLLMTQLPRDRVWMWLDSLVLNLVFFLLNMLSSWHLHFFHINHNNDNNYNDKMEVQRSERICPRTQLELRFGCGNHSVSLLAGLVFPLSSSSHFFFYHQYLPVYSPCLSTNTCLSTCRQHHTKVLYVLLLLPPFSWHSFLWWLLR